MKDSAMLALHAIPAEFSTWSKIGGLPRLGENHSWPSWKGKPQSFLAQIDFGEMAAIASLPDFPKTGRIFFFYDHEQSTWGFDPKDEGSWTVLFQSVASEDNAAVIAPEGVSEHGLYIEKPIGLHAIQSLPD